MAALVSKTALASGATIASTAHALGVMSLAETQALLVPARLTQPAAFGAQTLDG
jgi:aspartate ammonia-lyase